MGKRLSSSKCLCRVDDEFRILVNAVKIECLKKGGKAPSTTAITRAIAKRLKRENVLLYDEFIR